MEKHALLDSKIEGNTSRYLELLNAASIKKGKKFDDSALLGAHGQNYSKELLIRVDDGNAFPAPESDLKRIKELYTFNYTPKNEKIFPNHEEFIKKRVKRSLEDTLIGFESNFSENKPSGEYISMLKPIENNYSFLHRARQQDFVIRNEAPQIQITEHILQHYADLANATKGKSIGTLDEFAKSNPAFAEVLKQLRASAPKDVRAQRLLDGLANNWHEQRFLQRFADVMASKDYRAEVAQDAQNVSLMKRLESSGIKMWDDINYAAYYVANGQQGRITDEDVHDALDPQLVASAMVMKFMGHREEQSGEKVFVPGQYQGHLRTPVGTVYANLRTQLANLLAGKASREDCIYILSQLRAEHVQPDSEGHKALEFAIEALSAKKPNFLDEAIEVRVWQRNPLEDISSQEEFHCCGFGVKDDALNYLKDRGVTMLDFYSLKEGRVCRAILTPMEAKGGLGLLVDSFEGTDRMDTALAYQAIKDYAKACGFEFLAVSRHAGNAVPRKFVDYTGRLADIRKESLAGKILARRETFLEAPRDSVNAVVEQLAIKATPRTRNLARSRR